MPVYSYKAMDAKGKQVTGIIDADTVKTAKAKLRRENKFPMSFAEVSEKTDRIKGKGLSMEFDLRQWRGKVKIQELAIMTRQFATLVGAGIPVVSSLTALSKQVEDDVLKRAISQVREKVNEGSSLAAGLREHPKIFTDLYTNMVEAGEQSGTLEIVLDRLADFTEGQMLLRQKLRGALTYPILMFVVLIAVLGIMNVFVIPKIASIFKGTDQALPTVTLAVMAMSNFVQSYWWLLTGIFIGGFVGLKRWIKTPKGHIKWDTFLLWLPYVGNLVRKVAVSRFARTFGTLLASGVPIITAMDIVKNVVQNEVIKQAVEDAKENIREGQNIARPLERSGVFPPMVIHMIEVGEQTGELEDMLSRVSVAYENEVEAAVNGLTALLEPIMILVMAVGVGFALIAIILPLVDMTQGL
jgi:general secretion pathway protein F